MSEVSVKVTLHIVILKVRAGQLKSSTYQLQVVQLAIISLLISMPRHASITIPTRGSMARETI